MSFTQVLRKFSHPNLRRAASAHAGGDASDETNNPSQQRQPSEPMPTKPRFWRARRSSTPHRSGLSQSTSPTLKHKTEKPTAGDDVIDIVIPPPVPLLTTLDVFASNRDMAPLSEMIQAVSPVPVGLAHVRNTDKDLPSLDKASGGPDTVGVSSIPRLRF
jgi:hypothetical protein